MKRIIKTIAGFLPALALLGGCADGFGEKLLGPDRTVAPESDADQTVVFLNMTDAGQDGSPVTAEPVDVIFSSIQPIGQTRDITMSARMADGRSRQDCNFTVRMLDDETVLREYEEEYGYEVEQLPSAAFILLTDIISMESGGQAAVSQSVLRLINSESLSEGVDYLAVLELCPEAGYMIDGTNSMLYLHVKRAGGSGGLVGAADFRPMAGDNVLDADGVDLGINRNNLYYTLTTDDFTGLSACTIEGLIYVDEFKAESERSNGTLAGISSLWGYEAHGVKVDMLLRFGDAALSPDRLQLIVSDEKYLIDYTFRPRQWYHIAMTYDGSNLRFYVNGRERMSVGMTGTLNLSTGGSFHLGQTYNQWRGFNGMMSEVRVWNVARSSKELRDNMLWLEDAASDGLLAYWKMNEAMTGSGNTRIADETGNGNDLTVARQGASCGTVTPVVVINNDIDINIR